MTRSRTIRLRHLRTLEATPLVLAHRCGVFKRHGLDVELRPADGWSMTKNLLISGRIEAAHVPLPMPLACALGIDGRSTDLRIALGLGAGGGGLVVSEALRGSSAPTDMRRKRIGVPYRFSMSHYLFAHWLAHGGVNPRHEVTIEEVAPSLMARHLERGQLDAVFAQAPFFQQLIESGLGTVAVRARDIWPDYPGDVLAVRQAFRDEQPEAHRALVSAVAEGARLLEPMTLERAKAFAGELEPILRGCDPVVIATALWDQASRGPFPPRRAHAAWVVVQMQRWGQLVGRPEALDQIDELCLTEEAGEVLSRDSAPGGEGPIEMLGEAFDPGAVEAYREALPYSVYDPYAEPTQHLYTKTEAIFGRLGEIIDAMAEVGAGEEPQRLAVTSSGPMGLLEQAFNEMVANLQVAREEVEALHETLERRVEERTQELAEANEQLERLLHEDVLTGLHNRRHLTEALAMEFKRARRHGVPLSVLMIDLDHFKRVNDTHGHQVGDHVLATVADVMRRAVRETDVVARYGGEEFCAVLPHTPVDGGQRLAERVREAIAQAPMRSPSGAFHVTASVGVASRTDAMESEDQLIQAADDALYQAKQEGRDRVVCAATGG